MNIEMLNFNMDPIHEKCVNIAFLFWHPWNCMVILLKTSKFYLKLFILKQKHKHFAEMQNQLISHIFDYVFL